MIYVYNYILFFSIDGFLAMMDKVYAGAQDDESKAAIKAKADDIASRLVMFVIR